MMQKCRTSQWKDTAQSKTSLYKLKLALNLEYHNSFTTYDKKITIDKGIKGENVGKTDKTDR